MLSFSRHAQTLVPRWRLTWRCCFVYWHPIHTRLFTGTWKENWKIVIEGTKKTVSEESPCVLGVQPEKVSLIVQIITWWIQAVLNETLDKYKKKLSQPSRQPWFVISISHFNPQTLIMLYRGSVSPAETKWLLQWRPHMAFEFFAATTGCFARCFTYVLRGKAEFLFGQGSSRDAEHVLLQPDQSMRK